MTVEERTSVINHLRSLGLSESQAELELELCQCEARQRQIVYDEYDPYYDVGRVIGFI